MCHVVIFIERSNKGFLQNRLRRTHVYYGRGHNICERLDVLAEVVAILLCRSLGVLRNALTYIITPTVVIVRHNFLDEPLSVLEEMMTLM